MARLPRTQPRLLGASVYTVFGTQTALQIFEAASAGWVCVGLGCLEPSFNKVTSTAHILSLSAGHSIKASRTYLRPKDSDELLILEHNTAGCDC